MTHSLIGSIDFATDFEPPLAVVALDATKAFDQVNWVYLQYVVKFLNLRTNFCRALAGFYAAPEARILVNGSLTAPVCITR